MNDEQRQPLLEAWFSGREVAPKNVQEGVARVMADVPGTRQQGRWLPLPIHRPKTQTPTPTDTTEYQPGPIPASNGRAPTVIGRTTSMLSPAKAITAGAIVFALGGAFLIAQPFGQQGTVPGADGDEATTESTAPAIVSGYLMPRGDVAQEGTEVEVDGVFQTRGFVREGDWLEMDDPRLTGSHSTAWNTDRRTAGDAGTALVAVRELIENEEGSWSGTCTLLVFVPPGDETIVQSCLYTGAGAYDGLTAYLTQEVADTPNNPVKGVIFEGDLPPTPELPSAE